MGPTVQVLPGPTIPYEIFRQDQAFCQHEAEQAVAGQADSANAKALGAAAVGAALGAAVGAATSWHGDGAGAGAALGGTAGVAIGAGQSSGTQYSIQGQYNNAYVQCMYAKGNQVPGASSYSSPYYRR